MRGDEKTRDELALIHMTQAKIHVLPVTQSVSGLHSFTDPSSVSEILIQAICWMRIRIRVRIQVSWEPQTFNVFLSQKALFVFELHEWLPCATQISKNPGTFQLQHTKFKYLFVALNSTLLDLDLDPPYRTEYGSKIMKKN